MRTAATSPCNIDERPGEKEARDSVIVMVWRPILVLSDSKSQSDSKYSNY